MRIHTASIFSGAIALIISGAVWADCSGQHCKNKHMDKYFKDYDENLFLLLNKKDPLDVFLHESRTDMKFRSVYFDSRLPEGGHAGTSASTPVNDDQDWKAYAFGTELNFYSGYAYDHVGLDWSVYNVLNPLQRGNDARASGNFVTQNSSGNLPESFFVPAGLANVKFKAQQDNFKVNANAGYVQYHSSFLEGSGSRAIPAAYRGMHAEGTAYRDQLEWYVNLTNAIRYRSNGSMQNFKSVNNEKVRYIGEAGGKYVKDGFQLQLAYGDGHDYLKQYELQAVYDFLVQNATLRIKGQYFHAVEAGDLWQGESGVDSQGNSLRLDGFKNSADTNAFSISYILSNFNMRAAYVKIKAKGGMGFYQYNLAHNDYGAYNAPTDQEVSDFNHDSENTYQLSLNYAFDSVPGLKGTVIYTDGRDINVKSNPNITVKSEYEIDYLLSYYFQQPELKGLKLSAELYDLHQKGADSRAGNTIKYKDSRSTELRLYVDYVIALL